jgi:hypothetical protein
VYPDHPRSRCRRAPATRCTPPTGYSASVQNLSQVSLQHDNVFGNDGGALQLGTVTGDVSSGYAVSLTAKVDTRTTR